MSSSPLIHCHTAEAVATLTIARPNKLNALTDAVMKELVATLNRNRNGRFHPRSRPDRRRPRLLRRLRREH